jgi:hypothetical protein
VDFLKRYSGAFVFDRERNIGIDIRGFAESVVELCGDYCEFDDDEPHVNAKGFYEFALLDFHTGEKWSMETSVVMSFAFDATLSRPWGVYQGLPVKEAGQAEWKTEWRWCGETFLEWLSRVGEQQGRFVSEGP